MGRSPRLPTVISRVSRSAFKVRSPPALTISPGIMATSNDGVMHGHEFGAVGKCRLDLHFGNHLRYTLHDLVAFEQGPADTHEFGHGAPVTRTLENRCGDKGHRLGIIE